MKLSKIILGSVVALCGVAALGFGLYQTFAGAWEWLWLAIVGAGVAIAGVSLAAGAKRKEFVEMLGDTFGV